MDTNSILDYDLSELSLILEGQGFKKFRAKQVFNWVFSKGVRTFAQMANIPKSLRSFLEENYKILSVDEIQRQDSRNGETTKFLLELDDKNKIECVIIKSSDRNTLCLSSQVGCALSCKFCATGTMGFIRNLSVSEIISQFMHTHSIAGSIDNIVFMGMGEPFLNYENVSKAIRILNDKNGLNYGLRRITLSTAGIIKGIEKLIKDDLHIRLAVSLNSAIESKRQGMMPITESNGLKKLIEVLKKYQDKSNKRFTFEYVMIKGLNMSKADAEAIMNLSRELHFNLNVIPYNKIKNPNKAQPPYERPTQNDIDSFIEYFNNSNIEIVKRYRKGDDISAACGQLLSIS